LSECLTEGHKQVDDLISTRSASRKEALNINFKDSTTELNPGFPTLKRIL